MNIHRTGILSNRHGILVLAGCSSLMLVLGSVHAFSVFLVPIEREFDVPRSDASLTYSLALGVLTAMVLVGHHAYRRLTPARLAVVVTVVAVAGTATAGFADRIGFV